MSICSWEFYGEFDVETYGIEVLLNFVNLFFPGSTVDTSTYLSHHLINIGDKAMAKDSKYSM